MQAPYALNRQLRSNGLYSSILLLVLVLAVLAFLRPEFGSTTPSLIAEGSERRVPAEKGAGRLLLSDLDDLAAIQKAIGEIPEPQGFPDGAGQGLTNGKALSTLTGWERVDRRALRHQATLDYFRGFGF